MRRNSWYVQHETLKKERRPLDIQEIKRRVCQSIDAQAEQIINLVQQI